MPLDFPNHPTIGQVFGSAGLSWTWDGVKWTSVPTNLSGPFLPLSGGVAGGPLTTQNLTVNGAITGTGIGYDFGDIPGPIVNQAGIAALHPPSQLLFQRASFAATDGTDFHFRRSTAFSGGTVANINKTMLIESQIGANDGSVQYGLVCTTTNASNVPGKVMSAVIQAWKTAGNGICTGLDVSANEQQGTPSSLSGPVTTQEWDLFASGVDDGANTDRFGGVGLRQMIHAAFSQQSTTVPSHYTAGIWFGTETLGSVSAHADSLLCWQTPTQIRNFLDSRGAVAPTGVTDPVAAVRMLHDQIIDFNGGASLTSAPGSYLQYTRTGTARLRYMVGATEQFSFPDAGGVTIGAAGPTITTGSAVPASTQPKGSIYLRTSGAVGSTLYVSQGAGTWNAVAGA